MVESAISLWGSILGVEAYTHRPYSGADILAMVSSNFMG